ncbi:MAG: hypothetical protein JW803_03880 [Endomicrobiales bacterium]|nr:hypothetical protein [Endomicrobiales bacterium]
MKKGDFMKDRAGIYFLGFLGAVVFYIKQAATFWMGVLGIIKALVWPAMIVYKMLQFFYR